MQGCENAARSIRWGVQRRMLERRDAPSSAFLVRVDEKAGHEQREGLERHAGLARTAAGCDERVAHVPRQPAHRLHPANGQRLACRDETLARQEHQSLDGGERFDPVLARVTHGEFESLRRQEVTQNLPFVFGGLEGPACLDDRATDEADARRRAFGGLEHERAGEVDAVRPRDELGDRRAREPPFTIGGVADGRRGGFGAVKRQKTPRYRGRSAYDQSRRRAPRNISTAPFRCPRGPVTPASVKNSVTNRERSRFHRWNFGLHRWIPSAALLLADGGGELDGLDARVLRRCGGGRLLVDHDLEALVRRQARPGGDQAAHDDVLLDAAEIVGLSADGRLGEHLGRLLERRSADERLRRQGRLGDAEEHRLRDGRLTAALHDARVLLLEEVLFDLLVDEERRLADLLDAHATEHLTNDGLDVLVADADALQAIHLLDFVDEPGSELLFALHAQDVVRVRGTVLERIARAHVIARLHLDVLALRDQVFARLLGERRAIHRVRRDEHFALALRVLAERNDAVDLADDRVILGFSRLEELRHARQTARDVLHLGLVARDLR